MFLIGLVNRQYIEYVDGLKSAAAVEEFYELGKQIVVRYPLLGSIVKT